MNYLSYYNFLEEPFTNAPLSKFFYKSVQHSRAILRMMYAAKSMKGLAVLTGDIGTGKTTLSRQLLDSLDEEEFEKALLIIVQTKVDSLWLFRRLAEQFGISEVGTSKNILMNMLYERLIDIHEEGRKAVVLIDEAQMLRTREIMEEIRGLLNLEVNGKKLITFIFFGMPELEDYLKLDPPLNQRVAVKYNLGALNLEGTYEYILHRLKKSGSRTDLFSKNSIYAIHNLSRGVPRLINTICDNALLEAYMLKNAYVSSEIVKSVGTYLGIESGHVFHDDMKTSFLKDVREREYERMLANERDRFNWADKKEIRYEKEIRQSMMEDIKKEIKEEILSQMRSREQAANNKYLPDFSERLSKEEKEQVEKILSRFRNEP